MVLPSRALVALAVAGSLALPSAARAGSDPDPGASIAFVALSSILGAVNVGMVAGAAVDLGKDGPPNRTLGWAALGTGIAGGIAGLGGIVTGARMTTYDCGDADTCDGEDGMIRSLGVGFAIAGALGTALGIAAIAVGARDATRIVEPWQGWEAVPKPVVLRDRCGAPSPGLAWSVGW